MNASGQNPQVDWTNQPALSHLCRSCSFSVALQLSEERETKTSLSTRVSLTYLTPSVPEVRQAQVDPGNLLDITPGAWHKCFFGIQISGGFHRQLLMPLQLSLPRGWEAEVRGCCLLESIFLWLIFRSQEFRTFNLFEIKVLYKSLLAFLGSEEVKDTLLHIPFGAFFFHCKLETSSVPTSAIARINETTTQLLKASCKKPNTLSGESVNRKF